MKLDRRQFFKTMAAGTVAVALPAIGKPTINLPGITNKDTARKIAFGRKNLHISCHFVFKSKSYGYSGTDRECTLFYNDCNQMNFGGFPPLLDRDKLKEDKSRAMINTI